MRNVSHKHCRENQNTRFVFSNISPKIVGKSRAVQQTDDNTLGRTRFACWITKPTETHSEYVIRFAFHDNKL
jgi:hypothetical protein